MRKKFVILSVLIVLGLSLGQYMNSGYAQENTPSVKITSHLFGQEVPVGSLTIKGISSDNSTNDCYVFVIWNDLKPYQRVNPAGIDINDYSNWTFTFDSNYHIIKQGENKITSKIECSKPVFGTKWYSINVTGIKDESNTEQSVPFKLPLKTEGNDTLQQSSDTLQQSSDTLQQSSDIPKLLMKISIDKKEVKLKDKQKIKVQVTDVDEKSISNVNIDGKITYSSGTSETFAGSTNDKGRYSHTWKIPSSATAPSEASVEVTASINGYKPDTDSTTFSIKD